ncbi:MAG: hypothetical protein ABL986_07955 [Vicinamibacterales bacterium]
MPPTDFDEWHRVAMAEPGGMGGQRELRWPSESADRLALQLELVRRVSDGRLELFEFSHTFLTTETRYDDMVRAFSSHVVRPFARDLIRLLHTQPELEESAEVPAPSITHASFVSPSRITDLQAIRSSTHDVRKLVRLCEELNLSYMHQCYFAVAMLTRAVLDHVPPFFGVGTFNEVVHNYSWGRSRQDAMMHLQNSARKIADLHLHSKASADEILPNQAQVNFGPTLDVLLAEVIKLLK